MFAVLSVETFLRYAQICRRDESCCEHGDACNKALLRVRFVISSLTNKPFDVVLSSSVVVTVAVVLWLRRKCADDNADGDHAD